MPSTSLSPSYCGISHMDALHRIYADLYTRRHSKEGGFYRFVDQLYETISSLLESSDVADNFGALRTIDELIDVQLGENSFKVKTVSSYLRNVFERKRDTKILVHASRVLGHLARAGGNVTAYEVDQQIKIALDWLKGNNRVEYHRFAAVLILKEMAENASNVFNSHVPEFVDAIWVALRDPALPVREQAVEALRACLCVIEKHETRWRAHCYYRIFEATLDGLGKNAPVHSIHGSLLAIGELLRNTGEFMFSRYKEVAEIVLSYLEHPDRLIRLSITSLLPQIAHCMPDRFVNSYLTNYKSLDPRNPARVTVGKDLNSCKAAILSEMDQTMKKHMENYLHALEGISARLNHVENSVDELKVSVRNNHGSTDGKMRQLENIPIELQMGVQFLKDKQDVVEAQMQMANLQVSKVDQQSETQANVTTDPAQQTKSAPQPSQQAPSHVNLPQ